MTDRKVMGDTKEPATEVSDGGVGIVVAGRSGIRRPLAFAIELQERLLKNVIGDLGAFLQYRTEVGQDTGFVPLVEGGEAMVVAGEKAFEEALVQFSGDRLC